MPSVVIPPSVHFSKSLAFQELGWAVVNLARAFGGKFCHTFADEMQLGKN